MNPIRNALVAAGGAALALSSLSAAAEPFGRDNAYATRATTEPSSLAPVDWVGLRRPDLQRGLPLAGRPETTTEDDCFTGSAGLPLIGCA
jgi:hypothetical protein